MSRKSNLWPTDEEYQSLVGSKAGYFTVLEYFREIGSDGKPHRRVKLKCRCGNIRIREASSLRMAKSCGCARSEGSKRFKIKQPGFRQMVYPSHEARILLQYIEDIGWFAKYHYSKKHIVVKVNCKCMLLPYQVVVPLRVAQQIYDSRKKLTEYVKTKPDDFIYDEQFSMR